MAVELPDFNLIVYKNKQDFHDKIKIDNLYILNQIKNIYLIIIYELII